MTISGGTIISSLFSSRLLRRFETGTVTTVSVCMTALALAGFSISPSFTWFLILAVPLGLGAGAVDAGLNEFVAEHYSAVHMNWLHCFWGIGALISPLIMSGSIVRSSWRSGYGITAVIQCGLVIILVLALPIWKRVPSRIARQSNTSLQSGNHSRQGCTGKHPAADLFAPFKLPGAKPVLGGFLLYCGVESTTGLWGGSYLVSVKGLSPQAAAVWVSMFYTGITAGRFLSGLAALKFDNQTLIRTGQVIIITGACWLLLPADNQLPLAGLIMIGLGCAPIYPAMLHETPARFGLENARSLMGFQMAVAYTGSTGIPPLFGAAAVRSTMAIFPFAIGIMALLMWVCCESANRRLYTQRYPHSAD